MTPVVASALEVGRGWMPTSDTAILATRARDVFTAETPLLGQPSTAGLGVGEDVHHPGPLEFWVIAIGQRIHDAPATSLVVVVLVNLAAVATAVVVGSMVGGVPLASWTALLLTVLLWSLRGEILVDPLNPYAALAPFTAFLVACVAIAMQRWRALVPAAVFGSYAAQAHLTTAGMSVVAAASAAVIAVAVRSPNRQPRAAWLRPLLVTAVVLLVCWAAPLVEVIIHRGGNIAAFAATGGATKTLPHALDQSVDKSTVALGWPPIWTHSVVGVRAILARPSTANRVGVVLLGVVGVASAVIALVRRERDVAGAVGTVLLVTVGTTILFARFPGAFLNIFAFYNYLWLWAVSAVVWGVVGAGLAVAARLPVRLALLPALVALVVAGASVVDPAARPVDRSSPAIVRSLSSQLASTLDRRATYLFDLSVEFGEQKIDTGVVHELVRRGFDIRVTPRNAPSYAWRAVRTEAVAGTLAVRLDRNAPAPPTSAAEPVATFAPAGSDTARLRRAEQAVVDRIDTPGGIDLSRFPAYRHLAPSSVEAFVERDFLSMSETGFLGSTSSWKETRALAEAQSRPVLRAAVYLTPGSSAPPSA